MKCARRPAGVRKPASSAPARSPVSPTPAGSPRPEPRRGRCGARLFRLLPVLALLAGALGLFAPAPAQAQTVTLISNAGQTTTSGFTTGANNSAHAQAFTTGSGSYTLTSIDVALIVPLPNTAQQRANIKAELWSATSGGLPNSKVADLTVPSTAASGTVSFAAPASTTLSASTAYFFVLYTTGTYRVTHFPTNSDNEDTGGRSGWSIADNSYRTAAGTQTPTGTWTSNGNSLRISVKGTVAQATVPAAPTGLSLSPGDSKLDATWTAPSGTLTGYDVHYTSSTTVAAGAAALTGMNPSPASGWVAVDRGTEASPPVASQSITDLDNGTAYRVRVRAKNASGDGAWAEKSATPRSLPAGTVWEATLTAGTITGGTTAGVGCINLSDCASRLTVDSFTVGGQTYKPIQISDVGSGSNAGSLALILGNEVGSLATPNTALRALNFCVGSTAFALSDAQSGFVLWPNANLDWTAGDTVKLSIGTSCAQQTGTPPPPPTSGGPAVRNLRVTPLSEALSVAWDTTGALGDYQWWGRSDGPVKAWEVHYTSAAVSAVADDAEASGLEPGRAWVDTHHTGLHGRHLIEAVDGTEYRVRVRSRGAGNVAGAWAHAKATPGSHQASGASWTSTLTVKSPSGGLGCFGSGSTTSGCGTALSQQTFTHSSTTYTVTQLATYEISGTDYLYLTLSAAIPTAVKAMKLCADTAEFALGSGTISQQTVAGNTVSWSGSSVPEWTANQEVAINLVPSSGSCPKDVTPAPPGPPRDVRVTQGDGKLVLAWAQPATWGSWGAGGTGRNFILEWQRAEDSGESWGGVKVGNSFDGILGWSSTGYQFRGLQTNVLYSSQDNYRVVNGTAYELRIRSRAQKPGTDGTQTSHFLFSDWVVLENWRPQKHSHGESPASPIVTLLTEAPNAPTGTSLSFEVDCPTLTGSARLTDFLMIVQKAATGEEVRQAADANKCADVTSLTVKVTGLEPVTTYRVGALARNMHARLSTPSDWVLGTTVAAVMGGGTPDGTERAPLTASFEGVPETHNGKKAFRFDIRFSSVLGSRGRLPKKASFTVAGGTVKKVRYVERGLWRVRVKPTSPGDVTVRLEGGRYCGVKGAVCTIYGQALVNSPSVTVAGPESGSGQQQASVTPEVSIAAGAGVTEGADATFTLTAAPAPASALTVEVAVTQSGGYAAAGTHRVTIPASGSATLAVATQDDAVDEPDGSVTATLAAGAGYTVSSSKGAATVAVADDDVPEVSIAAGADVTEGADATFTLTANPVPASALTVEVAVTQSGEYATAGTRQVTIPPAGTATLAVATEDDAVDEPDGSVSAALAAGAGYTVSSAKAAATVAVADNDAPAVARAFIRTRQGYAREADDAIVFRVVLTPAVSRTVTVDYASADGDGPWNGIAPASAGADYTAVSGTLTFAPGETAKAVRVPLLDDAIDEGAEHVLMRFSNPQGASLDSAYREMVGYIVNDDPLQAMWLARFGRMVASDAVASVTARFETPRDAGSHVTLAGQRVDFGEAEGGGAAALATVLTGLARTFGAPSAPAPDKEDDPFLRHGLSNPWNDPAAAGGARRVTARELLLGTSFRAVLGQGAGSQWTSWGQGASVSQFSAGVPGLSLSGESATGSMGMDYERGRLLMGFAMTHSVGEGTARDAGWRYALGSTATMALPYARLALSDRLSVWGMAGTGSGTLSLDLDGSVAQRYRTDLAMTMAATGVRGELVTPAEASGFALALKADAFWVRTESDRVTASAFGSLMDARGESSRVRAVLDGSRTFRFASGAALTPKLELGVRHDAGDAETGTGLEFGAGLGWADPARGLDMALRVHGLAVHAADGYDEWGVSGQLRLVPGGAGRGLSMSLTPSWGVDPSGSQRLWALPASSGLAAGGNAVPSSRLDAEVGYGLALWGDRFTGTPNVGFGLSDTAREYRMGWRLTSAVRGDPGFEIGLDATRREAVNDNGEAEHGVMLRSMIRW